jgi:hypothetical protein
LHYAGLTNVKARRPDFLQGTFDIVGFEKATRVQNANGRSHVRPIWVSQMRLQRLHVTIRLD